MDIPEKTFSAISITSWLIVPIFIIFDQITKNAVIDHYALWESSIVWSDAFRFTRVHNPGAAFGILQSMPYLFTILTTIAIVFITWHKWASADQSGLYQFSLGLILAGAAGNLIDRIRFNYVIDFIDIGIGDSRWPAFNIADSCISVGVVFLLATCFNDSENPQEAGN
ncbi:MAG: signal peptidase II [Candidatus Lindowbacteria bacterium]|nr:signal peptidase II [Candidatus Lindowbacteria bacterium]